jgi:hypothetical protein
VQQQPLPDPGPGALPVDHRLEGAAQVRPARLAPGQGDPVISLETVAGEHVRIVGAQQPRHDVGAARGDQVVHGQVGRDTDPEPGPAAARAPTRPVHIHGAAPQFLPQLGHDGRQRGAGLLLRGTHLAGAPRHVEQVFQQALDLALAQPIGAGEQRRGRLQARASAAGRYTGGQRGAGGGAAGGARQPVQLIRRHRRLERGQLDHLVAPRLAVLAVRGVLAAPAGLGLAGDRVIGRQQGPLLPRVAGLTARRSPRGAAGRAPLDTGEVAGRGSQ